MFSNFFCKRKKRELKSGAIEKEMSYMMGVPKNIDDIQSSEVFLKRLKECDLFEFKGIIRGENTIAQIKYKGDYYEIELIPEYLKLTENYTSNHSLTKQDYKEIIRANYGITTAMKFSSSNIDSYHLQLKVLSCILPNMIGIVDFSSKRIISSVWAKLAAQSNVPPSPEYIYSIQAIYGHKEDIWLHTHGLNRCGSIEFEMLNLNKKCYKNAFTILQISANKCVENILITDEEKPFLISYINDHKPLIGTWISWELAITFYKEDIVGSMNERMGEINIHNKNTGVVYLYLCPKDCKRRKFNHVSILKKYTSETLTMEISIKEKIRRSKYAKERINYFKEAIKNPKINGIMKFGLLIDEEYRHSKFAFEADDKEDLFFKVSDIKDCNKIKGVLTQTPCYIKNLKINSEVELDIEHLEDWTLYTSNSEITPDSVYLLQMN